MKITRSQFLMSCVGAAFGQQADFSTSVRVVNVFVTVRDRDKRLAPGLTRGDFTLSEDGRSREIRYFAAQSDLPLTLGLLFDASGSQRTVIEEQRRASETFTKQLLREGDRLFTIAFHTGVNLLRGVDELATVAIGGEKSRGTALYDAVAAAAREAAGHVGRKAAVILSDGIDTASRTKLDAAIEAAQRADLTLYPVRVYDREVFAFDVKSAATDALREGKRALEKMARETGGTLREDESLESNYARIGEELRNQYSLGFVPEPGRTGYRKLRVRVNRRGFTVQARDGYFAAE